MSAARRALAGLFRGVAGGGGRQDEWPADQPGVQQLGSLWDAYRAASDAEAKRELLHCLLPLAVTLGPRGALPEVLRDSQAWSAAVAAGFAAEWSRHTGDAGHVGAETAAVVTPAATEQLAVWVASPTFGAYMAALAQLADPAAHPRPPAFRAALAHLAAAAVPARLVALYEWWLRTFVSFPEADRQRWEPWAEGIARTVRQGLNLLDALAEAEAIPT
eukprot:EG_transcript_26447